MVKKICSIMIAFFLLLGCVKAGRAAEDELLIGFNPDRGLMVGAEINLEKLARLPLLASFEAYPNKYNLFFTAHFPWEEKLDFYARAGIAEDIYLGLGVKLLLSWDFHLLAGFAQSLKGDSFLDLLASYRLSDNLHLKIRYHMYQGYLGIGYTL